MEEENDTVKIKVVDPKTNRVIEYMVTKEDSERSKKKQSVENIKPESPDFSYKNNTLGYKTFWSFEATVSLLNALERRYKGFNSPNKRRLLWYNISMDLRKQGLEFDMQTCSKKWRNLIRTYKVCHENLKRYNKLPWRFPYYKKMNRILTLNPYLLPKRLVEMGEENPISYLKIEEPDYSSDNEDVNFYQHSVNKSYNEFTEEEGVDNNESTGEELFWSYNDTIALIHTIQSHFDEFSKESSNFWSCVAMELQNDNIEVSQEQCKTKWCELFQAYSKLKNSNTTNFEFFDEIHYLLNTNQRKKAWNEEDSLTDEQILASKQDKLLLTITDETEDDGEKTFGIDVQYKNMHLNMVEPVNIELMESEDGHDYDEKFALWRRKLDLEERKVKALEDLLDFCRAN